MGENTQGIGVNSVVIPRFGGLNSFLTKKIAPHSKPPYTNNVFVQSNYDQIVGHPNSVNITYF